MSSTTHSPTDFTWGNQNVDTDNPAASFAGVLVPFGRVLYSLLFIVSGFFHFTEGSIAYATQQGVPLANVLAPLSGLMAILGGLSILLGYRARLGALILILFLIPVTLWMHQFWVIEDYAMRQVELSNFIKNFSLLGAAILICFFGAGPSNLDTWLQKRKQKKSHESNHSLFHSDSSSALRPNNANSSP